MLDNIMILMIVVFGSLSNMNKSSILIAVVFYCMVRIVAGAIRLWQDNHY